MAGKPSIKDVAERAGVSISTVSYVMSGKRKIGEETRQRVYKAAREIGYQPVLRTSSDVVCARNSTLLAVSAPMRPYTDACDYATYVFALASAARCRQCDVVLLMGEGADAEIRRVAERHLVDGILLLDVLVDDSRVEVAKSLDIPVVSIGCAKNRSSVYTVDMDCARMGRESIERAHLLGHDHALLYCPDVRAFNGGSNFLIRFRDAALARARELGMAVVCKFALGRSVDAVNLAIAEALSEDPQISVVICEENVMQISLIKDALSRGGLSVPEDVSLMAVCASSMSAHLADEMAMNPSAVCGRAVEIMIEAIEGKRNDVGYVELLPSVYEAFGTMIART